MQPDPMENTMAQEQATQDLLKTPLHALTRGSGGEDGSFCWL